MRPSLSEEERSWLGVVRRLLVERFPGIVERLVVFGSRARGDARGDLTMDLLLLIRSGNWRIKDAMARVFYDLAIGTEVVPSMHVYTTAEWERFKEEESVFREIVEREGLTVA